MTILTNDSCTNHHIKILEFVINKYRSPAIDVRHILEIELEISCKFEPYEFVTTDP